MICVCGFREKRVKKDIVFSDDGTYLDYKQQIYYIFDEDKSVASENAWFTGVNLPMLVRINFLHYIIICTLIME